MAQRNKSSWKRVAGAGIVAACSLVADVANAATRTADEVNDQFNQTGRAMSMTVGLMDNEQSLGEVVVRIDKDDAITVSKASLLAALNSNAGRSSLSAIEALPGDMLGLNALQTAGIGITFDKQKAVLVSRLNSNQRVGGDISLAQPPIKSGTVVKPASVSGYVNIFTEADYLWAPEQTALRFDAEAVLRFTSITTGERSGLRLRTL